MLSRSSTDAFAFPFAETSAAWTVSVSNETCCTGDGDWALLGRSDDFLAKAGEIPGNNLFEASEIAVPPLRPSKRVIKDNALLGPPTFSQGIQTL
ncbi:hypothetical protein [Crateriforma conspicua]|uniref:hypothetical protein n=1 Tax=Crateriforma conspicua TaxID=2527996 RepID=UPI0011B43F23